MLCVSLQSLNDINWDPIKGFCVRRLLFPSYWPNKNVDCYLSHLTDGRELGIFSAEQAIKRHSAFPFSTKNNGGVLPNRFVTPCSPFGKLMNMKRGSKLDLVHISYKTWLRRRKQFYGTISDINFSGKFYEDHLRAKKFVVDFKGISAVNFIRFFTGQFLI